MRLTGDPAQQAIFDEDSTIESWLSAERALAAAQAEHGVISPDTADAIAGAAQLHNIDRDALWATAGNVGYPVLGLVRQIAAALPAGPSGRVHYGATTQDIMDTGLALQMQASLAGLQRQVQQLGDALVEQATRHRDTVMAARTHAQQAVPTTFGATLAVTLAQVARQRERLREATDRVAVVSLFGAGGTAAALGPHVVRIRRSMARRLGLRSTDVPWHVTRDGPAEFGWLCATLAGTCARAARNIVDLSRTEVGEVFEPYSSHRGASSTMPQKVNPISSEGIIGAAGAAGALTSALVRMYEAGHERAAGEWQTEWQVLPQLAVLAGTALGETITIVQGLRVDEQRMSANLTLDHGAVLAEAHLFALAPTLGRELAHDVVYEAATRARSSGRSLTSSIESVLDERRLAHSGTSGAVTVQGGLGQAGAIVEAAVDAWTSGLAG
ncbi:lyase family protein [Actinoplanes sp. NPDC089786]|uniref:lyase family protein n=1 Tax=Actinoplanes sp. NPDC089786 TaxID=3155185 RepID=UPI00343FF020